MKREPQWLLFNLIFIYKFSNFGWQPDLFDHSEYSTKITLEVNSRPLLGHSSDCIQFRCRCLDLRLVVER